jgi:nucleoside-diphosphate-sugar epimerase
MAVIEKGMNKETYNIASGNQFTDFELATEISKIMKKNNLIKFADNADIYDKIGNPIDNSKLRNLGWKPEIKFKYGLDDCVNWYTINKWFLK